MNAMQAQATKVVRVRRANNQLPDTGRHMTLRRVVNEYPNRVFGFAELDDGTEVYIPAAVIRREQMTEHDVGAGLTARVLAQKGYENDDRHPIVQLPVQWDGDAEEIEVAVRHDDEGSMDLVNEGADELAELAQRVDDMVTEAAQHLGDGITAIKSLNVQKALEIMQAQQQSLEAFRAVLDEYAPEND